ncbi:hypothetical protein [Micromonospora sp. CPCC 205711]|uniref:hypothetical protein n=1 Tax=Micromonospora sp. CPCC 205547 TaxID=3122400 RepID=UPI002FF16E05
MYLYMAIRGSVGRAPVGYLAIPSYSRLKIKAQVIEREAQLVFSGFQKVQIVVNGPNEEGSETGVGGRERPRGGLARILVLATHPTGNVEDPEGLKQLLERYVLPVPLLDPTVSATHVGAQVGFHIGVLSAEMIILHVGGGDLEHLGRGKLESPGTPILHVINPSPAPDR